ncbi:MAG: cupin domain-containing protein [Pseudomonadota bacterium]
MIVANEKKTAAVPINSIEVHEAAMKVLISADEGWQDHVMRIVELGQNGYSPKHAHDWPHINYVVAGSGQLHMDGVDHEMEVGAYAFVPEGTVHQFKNTGETPFRFICIVPNRGHIV